MFKYLLTALIATQITCATEIKIKEIDPVGVLTSVETFLGTLPKDGSGGRIEEQGTGKVNPATLHLTSPAQLTIHGHVFQIGSVLCQHVLDLPSYGKDQLFGNLSKFSEALTTFGKNPQKSNYIKGKTEKKDSSGKPYKIYYFALDTETPPPVIFKEEEWRREAMTYQLKSWLDNGMSLGRNEAEYILEQPFFLLQVVGSGNGQQEITLQVTKPEQAIYASDEGRVPEAWRLVLTTTNTISSNVSPVDY